MRVVSVRKVEDCFDGSSVFTYHFAGALTVEEIRGLETVGRLELFEDFPRPFFRLLTPEGLQVKGVAGETSCRVIFPRQDMERLRRRFEERLASLVVPPHEFG